MFLFLCWFFFKAAKIAWEGLIHDLCVLICWSEKLIHTVRHIYKTLLAVQQEIHIIFCSYIAEE